MRIDDLSARLEEFDEQLARAADLSTQLRRDTLMWRAYDLSIQTPVTESQLTLVAEICTELSDAKYDPLTHQYAQNLLQWVERQRKK